jgi:rare lipoprotein A
VKFGLTGVTALILAASACYSSAEARSWGGGGQSGYASWYGPGFQGRRTASGERFSSYGYTAAHRSFPLGCHVLVTNRDNGRSVVVRINDRGPFVGGRVIDLSYASALAIGMNGTTRVSLARL